MEEAFTRIGALAGPGSQAARRDAVRDLLARATEAEQRFLVALLLGDLGQGALAGVMADAVAKAAGVPLADVRRALMLRGDLGAVAAVALADGSPGLARIALELLRPVQPMLAAPGDDLDAALERISPAAVEFKLDGVRVQVHRRGDEVRVFSRTLDDVTARVPEVVRAALALPADTLVLDGEAIALRADGRPEPFQVTASRFGTRRPAAAAPLTALFFDVLHADGEDLLDRPGSERFAALADLVPEPGRVPRAAAADAAAARARARRRARARPRGRDREVARGAVRRRPPRRGLAEGQAAPHARPRGARRRVGPRPPPRLAQQPPPRRARARRRARVIVMLGKTFKGLTDRMLEWQTARLLELEIAREGHVVHVRPELVVEIAFDGIQTSTRYPGGVALRFARVLRHRPDKPAAEADTLDAVLAVRG